jgi:hypothetical protein
VTSRESSANAARLRTLRRGGLGPLVNADRAGCDAVRTGGAGDEDSSAAGTLLIAASVGATREVAGEGEREGRVVGDRRETAEESSGGRPG